MEQIVSYSLTNNRSSIVGNKRICKIISAVVFIHFQMCCSPHASLSLTIWRDWKLKQKSKFTNSNILHPDLSSKCHIIIFCQCCLSLNVAYKIEKTNQHHGRMLTYLFGVTLLGTDGNDVRLAEHCSWLQMTAEALNMAPFDWGIVHLLACGAAASECCAHPCVNQTLSD